MSRGWIGMYVVPSQQTDLLSLGQGCDKTCHEMNVTSKVGGINVDNESESRRREQKQSNVKSEINN